MKGKISTGTVPKGLKPVYVHQQSRTLSQILVELLRASNNYIANQVFLEIGGTLGGSVSLDKSLKVLNKMLAENGLAEDIHMEEGSGISRDNRFTARGLAHVLELFAPHAELLHGHDGGPPAPGGLHTITLTATDNYFVVAGENGILLFSANGITWQRLSHPSDSGTFTAAGAAWSGNCCVLSGGPPGHGRISHSLARLP